MCKVSVIIPTYGPPDRLPKTIDSVLQQTFTDFELIIVDDNNPDSEDRKSTENCVHRAQAKDSRIQYICHPYNKNGSAARNTGISIAKGEYIAFLDSDDEYKPERLEKCVNALSEKETKEIQAVYAGCEFRSNGKPYHIETNMRDGKYLIECLASTYNICSGSNLFLTRDAVKDLNGFDEKFRRHQDIEFLVRYFLKYSIIGIPDILMVKNRDKKNIQNADKLKATKELFINKFKLVIERQSKKNQRIIYGSHAKQIAEQYLLERNYKSAAEYYKHAIKNRYVNLKLIAKGLQCFYRSLR